MFIRHAAIMYSNGEVVEGWNYSKIHYIAQVLGPKGEHIIGFTNSDGEFVLPQDAAVIAARAGQVKVQVDELMPDDLWPNLSYE